jgi:hypothetical protein
MTARTNKEAAVDMVVAAVSTVVAVVMVVEMLWRGEGATTVVDAAAAAATPAVDEAENDGLEPEHGVAPPAVAAHATKDEQDANDATQVGSDAVALALELAFAHGHEDQQAPSFDDVVDAAGMPQEATHAPDAPHARNAATGAAVFVLQRFARQVIAAQRSLRRSLVKAEPRSSQCGAAVAVPAATVVHAAPVAPVASVAPVAPVVQVDDVGPPRSCAAPTASCGLVAPPTMSPRRRRNVVVAPKVESYRHGHACVAADRGRRARELRQQLVDQANQARRERERLASVAPRVYSGWRRVQVA